MSEPRRMLDDGALGSALRSALAAEATTTTTTGDLAGLHARVLEDVASGAMPAMMQASVAAAVAPASSVGVMSTLLGMSKAGTGLAGLVLGGVLGAGGHALYVDATAKSAPIERVVVVEQPAAPTVDEARQPDVVTPVAAHVPEPAPPAHKVSPSSSKPQEPRVAPEPPQRPAIGADVDTLAVELRAYERGEDALKNRRYDVALRELDAYLQAYPRGELVVEAELSRLDALIGLGRGKGALSSAERLRLDKRFVAKRTRIELFLIEALVMLDRCDVARSRIATGSLDARATAAADVLVARCLQK
jgi:hypothetical protein